MIGNYGKEQELQEMIVDDRELWEMIVDDRD